MQLRNIVGQQIKKVKWVGLLSDAETILCFFFQMLLSVSVFSFKSSRVKKIQLQYNIVMWSFLTCLSFCDPNELQNINRYIIPRLFLYHNII